MPNETPLEPRAPVAFIDRLLFLLGAIAGLCGVAAAAAAAHVTGPGSLAIAANFLLFHGPLLVGIALADHVGFGRAAPLRLGGMLIAIGLVGFSGDLAVRALAGISPLPMAAPTGGTLLMLGWLFLAIAALVPRRA
jgi:uncharacterized membrane protein YgdD (TMEM256/DUF423 family)